jgi:hypothetical protein
MFLFYNRITYYKLFRVVIKKLLWSQNGGIFVKEKKSRDIWI